MEDNDFSAPPEPSEPEPRAATTAPEASSTATATVAERPGCDRRIIGRRAGMAASAVFDLPTGAAVVCTFGLTLLAFAVAARVFGWRPVRARTVLASRPLHSAEKH